MAVAEVCEISGVTVPGQPGFRLYGSFADAAVMAGLVPATPIVMALCLNNRGRRDKPGDDGSGVIQIDRKPQ
jgi:hypothetical protein